MRRTIKTKHLNVLLNELFFKNFLLMYQTVFFLVTAALAVRFSLSNLLPDTDLNRMMTEADFIRFQEFVPDFHSAEKKDEERPLTFEGFESILLDAQTIMSSFMDKLFMDEKGKKARYF